MQIGRTPGDGTVECCYSNTARDHQINHEPHDVDLNMDAGYAELADAKV